MVDPPPGAGMPRPPPRDRDRSTFSFAIEGRVRELSGDPPDLNGAESHDIEVSLVDSAGEFLAKAYTNAKCARRLRINDRVLLTVEVLDDA